MWVYGTLTSILQLFVLSVTSSVPTSPSVELDMFCRIPPGSTLQGRFISSLNYKYMGVITQLLCSDCLCYKQFLGLFDLKLLGNSCMSAV